MTKINIVDVMVAHTLGGSKELSHFMNKESALEFVSKLDESTFAFADVIYQVKSDESNDHIQTKFDILENLVYELQP